MCQITLCNYTSKTIIQIVKAIVQTNCTLSQLEKFDKKLKALRSNRACILRLRAIRLLINFCYLIETTVFYTGCTKIGEA